MADTALIVAVGPVIVEEGNVLLVRTAEDGPWQLPGGKLEDVDVDLVAAMQREAKEELGIDVSPAGPLDPFLLRTETDVRVLIPYYAVRDGEVTPGPGVVEAAWHPLDTLPENVAPNIVPALDSLLRLYGEER